MTVERIREIQRTTAYPDSVTIQQALLQVWNEVAQEMFTKEQVEELLKKQRESDFKKIISGLTVFTEKPIGNLEGDLCDWNQPSIYAHNYSPQELEGAVVKRIIETFEVIRKAPSPSLEQLKEQQ